MAEQQTVARGVGHVHHLIAEVAKGLAGEFWEQMATGRREFHRREEVRQTANKFYRRWPVQKAFVFRKWPLFLVPARDTLTAMLGDPRRSEVMKAEIAEALHLNNLVAPKQLSPEALVVEAMKKNDQPKR